MGAAEAFFVAGTIPFVVFGALHAIYALVDVARPTYFTPRDRSVRPAMEGTGVRIAGEAPPSLWGVWLGINIAFGLLLCAFGLLCLLVATEDFRLVERIAPMRPLTIVVSVAALAISLRFFFWAPVLITGVATVCFTVATVVS
jgi:hypothetical protein